MNVPVPVPERAIVVTVDGVSPLVARPKRFSTGSVGWYASEKIELDGVKVQVSLSMTVVGSKPKQGSATSDDKRNERNGKPTRKPEAASRHDLEGQITFGSLKPS